MKTRWTDKVDRNNPLPEYPRPQMERSDWMSLNGVYDYAIKGANCEWAEDFDGEIFYYEVEAKSDDEANEKATELHSGDIYMMNIYEY